MTAETEWIGKQFTDAKGNAFDVSVARIVGARPGPTLGLIAGQHGMEHTGVYVLRELIGQIDQAELSGTLLVCPAANPAALLIDYEIYPEREDLAKLKDYHYARTNHGFCIFGQGRADTRSEYNMNRLWPGRPDAGMAGQITEWLWQTVVAPADVIIDLHCCGNDRPHLLVPWEGHEKTLPLARYFGFRWVKTPDHPSEYTQGKLHFQANQGRRRCLTVEFSRQHQLNDTDRRLGHWSLRNVMRALGMLKGQPRVGLPLWWAGARQEPLIAEVRGHIKFHVGWYEPVDAGQLICEIFDVSTSRRLQEIRAERAGVVGGLEFRPISRPGKAIGWINEAMRIDADDPAPPRPQWQPLH